MLFYCGVDKTLESTLNCKIKPVNSKGNQSWVFIGRTDVEAETPILWPPDAKNWLIWKEPDAGRDWEQEEKGMTEDEMAGWYHWLDGCESELWELVMDKEAWRGEIHGVAKSRTRLSNQSDLILFGIIQKRRENMMIWIEMNKLLAWCSWMASSIQMFRSSLGGSMQCWSVLIRKFQSSGYK